MKAERSDEAASKQSELASKSLASKQYQPNYAGETDEDIRNKISELEKKYKIYREEGSH